MLAYSDFLAQRWLEYFKKHEDALDIEIGGKTGNMRNLVGHIFQVENFFANFLLQEPSVTPTAPPPPLQAASLETLSKLHRESLEKLEQFLALANEERLRQTRKLGPVTVSNRKILAQPLFHSVHHWAQVAMEVRQAGFPPQPPQDIIISPVMQ